MREGGRRQASDANSLGATFSYQPGDRKSMFLRERREAGTAGEAVSQGNGGDSLGSGSVFAHAPQCWVKMRQVQNNVSRYPRSLVTIIELNRWLPGRNRQRPGTGPAVLPWFR